MVNYNRRKTLKVSFTPEVKRQPNLSESMPTVLQTCFDRSNWQRVTISQVFNQCFLEAMQL